MSLYATISRAAATVACAAAILTLVTPAPAYASDYRSQAPHWETDYALAMQRAERQQKMLLIHFFDEAKPASSKPFLKEIESKPALTDKLSKFVLARLPLDTEITVKGQPSKLLDHPAFAEMEKRQGLVVIDYANERSEYYGHVVSALPFKSGKYYHFNPKHVAVILDLPPGTQTQRALVFAVRIHPESPKSAKGELDPHLVDEAKSHSNYQARIHVQGHHNWESRFPRISRLLPFGLRPQEVVAESWPHENLLDAAVDCVHSWRQSSGHWGAVKQDQPKFAYDMRRGSNGIWYATGIFGNYH
ncbi:MAG TPA: hypothetical protein VGG64_06350 [Pirellulales bacterium]